MPVTESTEPNITFLAIVAVGTTQAKIAFVGCSTMFLGNDMLDMVWNWAVDLALSAVLAAAPSALKH